MKDELISFETAKLAKEKRFNITSDQWYRLTDQSVYGRNYKIGGIKPPVAQGVNRILAPTQSLLQRWLREVHHIDVIVRIEIVSQEEMYTVDISHKTKAIFPSAEYILSFDYEDALEYGLQEALKTLEL